MLHRRFSPHRIKNPGQKHRVLFSVLMTLDLAFMKKYQIIGQENIDEFSKELQEFLRISKGSRLRVAINDVRAVLFQRNESTAAVVIPKLRNCQSRGMKVSYPARYLPTNIIKASLTPDTL